MKFATRVVCQIFDIDEYGVVRQREEDDFIPEQFETLEDVCEHINNNGKDYQRSYIVLPVVKKQYVWSENE